jgi:type IV secretory pathway TrbD component
VTERPGSGTTLLAALAIGLCCGLPAIIASGALATAVGVLLRAWPITLFGLVVLIYGAARMRRRIRAIRGKVGNP